MEAIDEVITTADEALNAFAKKCDGHEAAIEAAYLLIEEVAPHVSRQWGHRSDHATKLHEAMTILRHAYYGEHDDNA